MTVIPLSPMKIQPAYVFFGGAAFFSAVAIAAVLRTPVAPVPPPAAVPQPEPVAVVPSPGQFPPVPTPEPVIEPAPVAPSIVPPLVRPAISETVVNAGDGIANLRAGPSTESEILGQVQNGSIIRILQRTTNSSNQRWLLTPDGWIYAGLTQDEPLDYNPFRESPVRASQCSAAYPDVCIPTGRADLNCSDIPYRNFPVRGSDPHGFDRDRDGIGCEA